MCAIYEGTFTFCFFQDPVYFYGTQNGAKMISFTGSIMMRLLEPLRSIDALKKPNGN